MIKIEKGSAPSEGADKCQTLTEELKRMYGALLQLYQEKARQTPRVPITLGDEDYKTVHLATWPGKGKAPSAETAKKALNQLVFGEQLLEVMSAAPPVDEGFIRSLQNPWRVRMNLLLTDYKELDQSLRSSWPALGLNEDNRLGLLAIVRRNFQRAALIKQQPFTTPIAARAPQWFSAEEMKSFGPIGSLPPEGVAGCVGAYQKVLDGLREQLLVSERSWLAPALWMCAETDPGLIEAALFEFAVSIYLARVRENRPLALGMTGEEVGKLVGVSEIVALDLAYYFLAARALSEVIDDALAGGRQVKARPLIGFKSDVFDSGHYSGHGIKEALMASHFGKCAFCESKVRHIAHGDVEHFRPKAGYEQGWEFNHDGYFWEAYSWDNFLYSCQTCNQVYKKNKFPVLLDDQQVETRSTYERKSAEEKPVLINPSEEDPRLSIRFNPINGEAYPFDLVEWYLTKRGIAPVNESLWNAPKEIPTFDPSTYKVVTTTDQKFKIEGKNGHALWQALPEAPPEKLRGVRTIQLLGLNRAELRLQRVVHLRNLRGLFWTWLVKKTESEAALVAFKQSLDQRSEFSSLSLDAWETWYREKTRAEANVALRNSNPLQVEPVVDQWIDAYNKQLSEQPTYALKEQETVDGEDAIMYFVTPQQLKVGTDRQLVYLTQAEEIPSSPAGWYLGIDAEDHHLSVRAYKAAEFDAGTRNEIPAAKTTITELLTVRPSAVHHKFKDKRLLVAGPFKQKFKV